METPGNDIDPTPRVRARHAGKKLVLVVLGVLVALVVVELGLRAAGWILLAVRERANRISVRERGGYRILCLGESTTAAGGSAAYPRQLETILNDRGIGVRFKVINRGISGTTTANILSELDRDLARYEPDMVVTMMGINDRMTLGGTVPYAVPVGLRIKRFLRNLRVYKLGRYAWDRLAGRDPARVEAPARNRFDAGGSGYTVQLLYEDMAAARDLPGGEAAVRLGRCLVRQGRFREAERVLRDVIRSNPRNDDAVAELGWCHALQAWFVDSREAFRHAHQAFQRAVDLNPRSYPHLIGLGVSDWFLKRRNEARAVFARAVKLAPEKAWAYFALGQIFMEDGLAGIGVRLFNLAIEKDPRFYPPYHELAKHYRGQGRPDDVRKTYLRAAAAGLQDDVLFGQLAAIAEQRNEPQRARHYREEANRIRLARYRPATRYNYNRLKEKVLARGLKLVCVQYPLRSVAPLKKLLQPAGGVLFVDNEAAFEEARRRHGYDHLFIDHFGGDFGHCTPEGNRLLAANVAAVILREVFHVTPGD